MLKFLKKRRIRWLLAITLVILLGGGALLYWYSRVSLADFVDLDLRALDDTPQTTVGKMLNQIMPGQFPGPQTKLNQLLKRILPEEYKPAQGVQPHSLWHVKTKIGPRFILLESKERVSGVCILFLNSQGKYKGSSEFHLGRSFLGGLGRLTMGPTMADAALVNHELLGATVIAIKTVESALGPVNGRQIYGIFENRVALLRIEDHDGNLVANHYIIREHQVGPSPPTRTKAEWEELVDSSDPTHVLEALTWIGGHHRADDIWRPEMFFESVESVRLVTAVRNSPVVQKRIAELTTSDNQWIREAAVLALEQLPKKAER
jgi:hypothetical protein